MQLGKSRFLVFSNLYLQTFRLKTFVNLQRAIGRFFFGYVFSRIKYRLNCDSQLINLKQKNKSRRVDPFLLKSFLRKKRKHLSKQQITFYNKKLYQLNQKLRIRRKRRKPSSLIFFICKKTVNNFYITVIVGKRKKFLFFKSMKQSGIWGFGVFIRKVLSFFYWRIYFFIRKLRYEFVFLLRLFFKNSLHRKREFFRLVLLRRILKYFSIFRYFTPWWIKRRLRYRRRGKFFRVRRLRRKLFRKWFKKFRKRFKRVLKRIKKCFKSKAKGLIQNYISSIYLLDIFYIIFFYRLLVNFKVICYLDSFFFFFILGREFILRECFETLFDIYYLNFFKFVVYKFLSLDPFSFLTVKLSYFFVSDSLINLSFFVNYRFYNFRQFRVFFTKRHYIRYWMFFILVAHYRLVSYKFKRKIFLNNFDSLFIRKLYNYPPYFGNLYHLHKFNFLNNTKRKNKRVFNKKKKKLKVLRRRIKGLKKKNFF